MNLPTFKSVVTEVGKDAPIGVLAGSHFLGLTPSDWMLLLGVIYAIGRLGWFAVECYWTWKDRHGPSK